MNLKIEYRKAKDLKFYPGNPRKISREMLEKLKKSIKEFGIVDPLVINPENQVIGGNQRLLAIRELGIEEVPVVVIANLPKSKEKALNIALNSIQGEFDEKLIEKFIADIEPVDLELTGLDLDDIETAEEDIEFEEVEPRPYRKFHILLSFDIDAYAKQIDKINEFLSSLEGVEIEKSQN